MPAKRNSSAHTVIFLRSTFIKASCVLVCCAKVPFPAPFAAESFGTIAHLLIDHVIKQTNTLDDASFLLVVKSVQSNPVPTLSCDMSQEYWESSNFCYGVRRRNHK